MAEKQTLFDAVGGLPVLQWVHKIFYDKVYAHPWLGKFFEGHSQVAIEGRQTSFMAEKMGGPVEYMGKHPKMAHRHMYITEELFELRRQLLAESLREAGLSDELSERWLRIDSAFMNHIVNRSIAEFYQESFKYEQRLIIPKPHPDP